MNSTAAEFGTGGSTLRSLWRYQPIVPVAIAVAGGVVVDRTWSIRVLVGLPLAAVWLACWVVALWLDRADKLPQRIGRGWLSSVLLLFAVATIGETWHHVYWNVYPERDVGHWCDRESKPVRLRGVLDEEPLVIPMRPRDPLRAFPEETRTITRLAVVEIRDESEWTPASGKAHVVIDGDVSGFHAGDRVEILGDLIRPNAPSNPGEFNYSGHLRAQRTRAVLRCETPGAIGPWQSDGGDRFGWRIARIAGACERTLRDRLPSGQAEIAVALLLGRYELLEDEVTERYMRTGTMHILAISGQHLAVLAWFLWLVLRFVPVPRKLGAVFLAAIVVNYAMLTGARPPVLRAAVLVSVFVGEIVIGARSRKANPLALALLIVLAVNPADLFDRGLQLSFLAVAALSWIVEPLRQWMKHSPEPARDPVDALLAKPQPWWRRQLRRAGAALVFAVLMSAVVWLANVPLLAARFNLFSPIVVPLTVVLVPLATLSLITGLALLLVDPWWSFAASRLAKACGLGIGWMDGIVEWSLQIPFGHTYVPGPPDWWVISFYIGAVGVHLFRPVCVSRWRWAVAGVAWLAIGFAVPALRSHPNSLECQILAVGNGSVAALRTPGGRIILVDAGQIAGPRVGSRLIAPALWQAGIRRIDAVFVSHADIDHFNGLLGLIERFSIGGVFVPPHFAHSDHAGVRLVLEELDRRGVPIRVSFDGDKFDLGGGVNARVLHPPAEFRGTDNEQSLVLLVEYRGRTILLTGDLEGAGLRRLLDSEPLDVDVLVAPHHGSRRANPPQLVEWARPEWVVVSQGKPRSGATLDAYRAARVPVLSTNDVGVITIDMNERVIQVRGKRELPQRSRRSE